MRAFVARLCLAFLWCGVLFLAESAPVLALPPRQAVTPVEFWQRIDQTLSTLRGLRSQPDGVITRNLDDLAGQWSRLDALTLPDSSTTPLDTSFIVSQLRQRPYDLDALSNLFTDLHNAHGLKPTRTSSAADLTALQTILRRPEFQWDQPPNPLQEWWDALWKRINDWLNGLLGRGNLAIPLPAGDLLTVMASLALALILVYIFRGLFTDLIVDSRLDEDHQAGDELLTADTALQKAKDISRSGDYRTAVRYLYLSSLLQLDERGLLRFDRSKTNREYLRTVAAYPELSMPLRDVIDVFDRVWYGFQPLGQDDFQHYVEKVDQLRDQKR